MKINKKPKHVYLKQSQVQSSQIFDCVLLIVMIRAQKILKQPFQSILSLPYTLLTTIIPNQSQFFTQKAGTILIIHSFQTFAFSILKSVALSANVAHLLVIVFSLLWAIMAFIFVEERLGLWTLMALTSVTVWLIQRTLAERVDRGSPDIRFFRCFRGVGSIWKSLRAWEIRYGGDHTLFTMRVFFRTLITNSIIEIFLMFGTAMTSPILILILKLNRTKAAIQVRIIQLWRSTVAAIAIFIQFVRQQTLTFLSCIQPHEVEFAVAEFADFVPLSRILAFLAFSFVVAVWIFIVADATLGGWIEYFSQIIASITLLTLETPAPRTDFAFSLPILELALRTYTLVLLQDFVFGTGTQAAFARIYSKHAFLAIPDLWAGAYTIVILPLLVCRATTNVAVPDFWQRAYTLFTVPDSTSTALA